MHHPDGPVDVSALQTLYDAAQDDVGADIVYGFHEGGAELRLVLADKDFKPLSGSEADEHQEILKVDRAFCPYVQGDSASIS
jgi:hypothetical protein